MPMATISQAYSWLGISTTFNSDDTFVLNVLLASIDALFADFLGFSVSQATRTEYYPPRVNLTQRDMLVDAFERSGTNKVVPIDRYRNERRVIGLRSLPVRSIVSVYENPAAWLSNPADFSSEFLLASDGSQYYLDMDEAGLSRTGFLIRNTGPWSIAERCVQVTYVGGLTDVELGSTYAHFQHAFLTQLQVSYNARKIHQMANTIRSMPGIINSESLGDWSASYDAATNAGLYGLKLRLAPAVQEILEPHRNYTNFVFQ